MPTPVLLHTIGGGGPWDEVIVLGLIGGLMLVLVVLGYRSSRRRRSGRQGQAGRRRPRA